MHNLFQQKIFLLWVTIFMTAISFTACQGHRSSGELHEKHTHTNPIETTAPTCTENGKNIYNCWCGYYLYEPIQATGHKYVDGICENCNRSMLEELTYTLSKDGCYYILSGIGNYSAPTLTVPDNYKDLPVREIGKEAFKDSPTEIISVQLGNNVTTIAESAFACSRIQNITLGNALTSIEKHAFSSCFITSINLPQSLTTIGVWAFSDSHLQSIAIPDKVTKIENDTFALCDSLQTVIIGNDIISIGQNAFHQCTALKNIIIGEKVTSIESNAFYECTSLTNVYFNGTRTAWNGITIGKLNTYLTDATIHYQAE